MGVFVKRILSCLVIIPMLCAIPAYGNDAKVGDFYRYGEDKIRSAKELGIITTEMHERSGDGLSRYDASIILYNLYTHLTGKSNMPTEIVLRDTDEKEPNMAYKLELMDGYSKTIFGSTMIVKREEFAWYILKVLKAAGLYEENAGNYYEGFADMESISLEYLEAVSYLAGYNIIDKNENNFKPKENITIGEAAYIVAGVSEFFYPKAIEINKKEIRIGEDKNTLLSKFGTPDKIGESMYGSEKYVYFLDTGYFSASINSQGKIEEIFTNSSDFKYYTINGDRDISDFKYFNSGITYKYTMQDNYTYANVYFDCARMKVDGIWIKSNEIKSYVLRMDESYSFKIKEELADIINCSRKRFGMEEYVLSPQASKIEDRQCGYMSMKARLTHNYVDNMGLSMRFSEGKIKFLKISENIACSTSGAADIFYYWSGIPGMRGNIYSEEYKSMGAGCVLNRNLIYCAFVFFS